MGGRDDIIQLIKAISGQSNMLTIPRLFIDFTKSHRAALFLSQCIYWSDRSSTDDGWFYKSFREWKYELGLNQHAVETCVARLVVGGWIETKIDRVGIRDTTFYRVKLDSIAETVRATLAVSANVETAIAETAKVPKQKTIRSSIRQRSRSKTTDDSSASTTRAIQDRYVELLGYKPDDWSAGEAKAAKAIAKKWTPDQLATAYQHFKKQTFYKDKRVTLRYLNQQMPELFKNGSKTNGSHSTSNHPATPADAAKRAAVLAEISQREREKAAARGDPGPI